MVDVGLTTVRKTLASTTTGSQLQGHFEVSMNSCEDISKIDV